MNQNILNTETQDFITKNLKSDIAKLLFKGSPFKDISIKEIVEQIESKSKSKSKLPKWFESKNIYYPNKLNIEQTSSEITANYKAKLLSGNTIIDLTGGFGVDCFAFSTIFKEVTHCEINNELSAIVKHNFKVLNTKNITTIAIDGLAYLKTQKEFDWIYIDPSRRNDIKGKVFLLNDCLPNIPENLDLLFKHSKNILIKASPLLDITSAINELKFVKEVHIIAVQNEVKELLFVLDKLYKGCITIKTVNLTKHPEEHFEAIFKDTLKATYSEPQTYLYEPNSAILKAGLFNEVSVELSVSKLNINSHLYTSSTLQTFPGRSFKVLQQTSYNLKALKKILPSKKANITTRNFPETVAQIRKKTKLKDGGDTYLFFTTDCDENKIVLICERC